MKLSKKNRTCQNAIRKALMAGKPISGILAGLLSVIASGCRPRSPANTMGSYPKMMGRFPDPSYENRKNETNSCEVTMGETAEIDDKPGQQPKTPGK